VFATQAGIADITNNDNAYVRVVAPIFKIGGLIYKKDL